MKTETAKKVTVCAESLDSKTDSDIQELKKFNRIQILRQVRVRTMLLRSICENLGKSED
ncbi:MAG: hypothetical protein ACLFUS_09490 [Candidatus Sumerlaeia bacterium]